MYTDEEFFLRLAKLRTQMGVSQREMSLTIGQNAAYINNIENGHTFPSMPSFFIICDYLSIEPKDFFDCDNKAPSTLNRLNTYQEKMSKESLDALLSFYESLKK